MSSVIIVGGDDDRRDSLVSFFRQLGFDAILSTADAGFALEVIRSGPAPTLVLLDMHEPQVDAPSVLAAIRADPRLASIPVVSVSADADQPPQGFVQHVRVPMEGAKLDSSSPGAWRSHDQRIRIGK